MVSLGERLSLRHAWRITRGNTLRLGAAIALCMVPTVALGARLFVTADRRAHVGQHAPLGARRRALAVARLRRVRAGNTSDRRSSARRPTPIVAPVAAGAASRCKMSRCHATAIDARNG